MPRDHAIERFICKTPLSIARMRFARFRTIRGVLAIILAVARIASYRAITRGSQ
jgi:hypothetical protein